MMLPILPLLLLLQILFFTSHIRWAARSIRLQRSFNSVLAAKASLITAITLYVPISEIGVEPTHGAAVPASTPANIFAVQFNGFAGDVKIYRQ